MSATTTIKITIREWAIRERVAYRTALTLARQGQLPGAYHVGRGWRVDLDAWEQAIRLARQTKAAP